MNAVQSGVCASPIALDWLEIYRNLSLTMIAVYLHCMYSQEVYAWRKVPEERACYSIHDIVCRSHNVKVKKWYAFFGFRTNTCTSFGIRKQAATSSRPGHWNRAARPYNTLLTDCIIRFELASHPTDMMSAGAKVCEGLHHQKSCTQASPKWDLRMKGCDTNLDDHIELSSVPQGHILDIIVNNRCQCCLNDDVTVREIRILRISYPAYLGILDTSRNP